MEKAKKPHADALKKMEADIAAFQSRIKGIEKELLKKAAAIAEGEKELEEVMLLAGVRIRQFYIRSSTSVPMLALLSSTNVGSALRSYAYQQAVTSEDKKVITQTALLVKDLEERKKKLEKENTTLSSLKDDLDKRAVSVRKLVGEATAYQTKLSSLIASLTAQQQSFLAQKLAGLNISRSANTAGRCDSDLTNGRDPGFSPKFAFFTYGVPNRIGMNQYGAWGRAKQGQNETQILQAYYNYDEIKKWDTGVQIRVDGYSTPYSLDNYVKRIYEIPDSWTDNNLAALKAQAIAARSYVLAYTNNGNGSICATESCQVFKGDPKGGNWEQAVNQTEGQVMVKGGNPIKAWFSSTHGGYIFSSGEIGWNPTDWTKHANDFVGSVNSFDDLKNNAYDKDSTWFYCDWGSRSEYAKTAWLKQQELADIVNVILLVRKNSSNACFVYQPDKPPPAPDRPEICSQPGNCCVTDNWSADKVKQELGSGVFNNIDSVSISADFGFGRSTNVNGNGDAGSFSFSGSEFKDFFNLRAPANIQIVGPLFNIEKK